LRSKTDGLTPPFAAGTIILEVSFYALGECAVIIERIRQEGLAANSYLIGAGGAGAVIDPRRDCQIYVDLARKLDLKILCVLETHRNEDFVSGSRELASLVGAEIYHGPGLNWKYGHTLKDGQEFALASLRVKVLHTPGHTDESMSYTVTDRATGDGVVMVFSGDALFVGDVGRTDLAGQAEVPRMAANLYDSIFGKLLKLPDGVILCPAHGAGSVCGRRIASRGESTIGIELEQNPLLQLKDKMEFVVYKVAEQPERPPYFDRMEKLNLEGAPPVGKLPLPEPLTPLEFQKLMGEGAVAVDANEPTHFGGAHIEGAYSIWREGLPAFGGWVLPYDKPILLVLEDTAYLEKAVAYLRRLGYDNIAGYLEGGMDSWYGAGMPVESLPLVSVYQLKDMLDSESNTVVLDTRTEDEWQAGHIKGARHIYVGHLEARLKEVPKTRQVVTICSTGHRASLAASILLRAGYRRVHNVLGGVGTWMAAGFTVTR